MNQTKQISEINHRLRELDSIYPGSCGVPLFQFKWAPDLISILPEYEVVDGMAKEVMDYRCQCGVNKIIHEPTCAGLTSAKVRMRKVSTCGPGGEFSPTYAKSWLLCRWLPPPPFDTWVESMGTDEDYPSHGRYLPVSRGAVCVALSETHLLGASASEIASRIISMMREHRATQADEAAAAETKARMLHVPIQDERGRTLREPDKGSRYWNVVDAVKEKMRKFNPTGTVGYSGTSAPALTQSKG